MTDERVVCVFINFDTGDMLVPGMRIPGIRWECGKKNGCCDVARNVEFSVCEVVDSFLKAHDVSGDIAAGGELLGETSEPKHYQP